MNEVKQRKKPSKVFLFLVLFSFLLVILYLLHLLYNPRIYFRQVQKQKRTWSTNIEPNFKNISPFYEKTNCNSFEYDASEWTLKYLKLNETKENGNKIKDSIQCKNRLKELLNGKSVKRIIHKNNTIENCGCTKHTTQCNESAYFNNALMKRVNTPPCCREKLLEILNTFSRELQILHVPHMLAFGAVLGWARYGKMIPYDRDIDLIIDKSFWNTTLFFDTLRKIERINGHKSKFEDNGKKLCITYSAINQNLIDIWPFEIIKRVGKCPEVSIPHYFWKLQPLENLFPERYVRFENIMTYVPRDPHRYLNTLYKNWKKELDCSYKKENKCSEKESDYSQYNSESRDIMLVIIILSILLVIILYSTYCIV
ncbi:uncharacterized protein LOC105843286 [Hydra vulgaris]|uniref:uncharacterized protein LOC105843286 n=1 Tax=Hydra vulgaris TaxID=6087 RepID=UPI001F5EC4D8|nr:uncharacterized protein LOC105843286 [Hydra vulgaris]